MIDYPSGQRNPQEITPRMFCKTVEIILLDEVDDIYKIASEADSDLREFIISRYRHNDAMQFSARKRNTIIQVSTFFPCYMNLGRCYSPVRLSEQPYLKPIPPAYILWSSSAVFQILR